MIMHDVLTFGEFLGLFSFHVPGSVLLVDLQSVLHPFSVQAHS